MPVTGRRDVVVAIIRATTWVPFAVGTVIGTGLLLVPLAVGIRFEFLDVALLARLSMVALLSGCCFVLDDATMRSTFALPVSASQVAWIRIASTLAVFAVAWAGVMLLAPHLVTSGTPDRTWALAVEPFALLPWIWAAAWVRAVRDLDGNGSALAAPVLFAVAAGLAFLPHGVELYVNPGAPDFAGSRLRWMAVLAAGSAVLTTVLLGSLAIPSLVLRFARHGGRGGGLRRRNR